MKDMIRIESDGPTASHARVYVLGEDTEGNETKTEISRFCTGVRLDLDVNRATTASLDMVFVGCAINAEVEKLVVKHAGHSRLGRRLWPLRKWWWGVKVEEGWA